MRRKLLVTDSFLNTKKTNNHELLINTIDYAIEFEDISYTSKGISQKKLFDEIKKKNYIPKTSQPSYQNMYDAIENAIEEADELFFLVPSRKISGTYQGAVNVCNEFNENKEIVHLIEAPSISVSESCFAEYILDSLENNLSTEDILKKVNDIKGCTYAFPADINFLKLSGRVNGAQAAVLEFLKIRVVVKMMDFKKPTMDGKGRGFKFVQKYLKSEIIEKHNIKKIYLSNLQMEEKELAQIKKIFEQENINYEIIEEATPVVSVHFGPSCFGIYIDEK